MAVSPSVVAGSSRQSTGASSDENAKDAVTAGPALAIRRARFTTRWDVVHGVRAQAVEVTLANMLPSSSFAVAHTKSNSTTLSITSAHTIELTGPGLTTRARGVVRRLVPGDQARVDVFITNTNTKGTATVIVRDPQGRVVLSSPGWAVQGLVETWTAEREVLERHETPVWVSFPYPPCVI
jgi:hypothetical protein